MAKAKKDAGNPGDDITVPASPDELVSIPTGKDGEAVVMTREEAENREAEGEKKSLFKKKNVESSDAAEGESSEPTPIATESQPSTSTDITSESSIDLEAELAAIEIDQADRERQFNLNKIIEIAKEAQGLAIRNGHRGVASDFTVLGTVATKLLARTNKEKFWLPRVK